jgi:TusE/DsrC/DsvC family sulfur relay protein
MNTFEHLVGSDGYITDPSQWSNGFAEWRMNDMDLPVSLYRTAVIKWIREYIEDNGITPSSAIVIRKGGKHVGYTSKEFYVLFPNGPKQAAMIAGGMRPSGC